MLTFDPIETSSQFTSDRVFEVVQSEYTTAGNYAVWAQNLMETSLKDIKDKLDGNELLPALQDLLALADAIQSYTPGSVAAFNDPGAPVYLTVPTYDAPTLAAMLDIPVLTPISIPAAPSSAISFTNATFSDSLLTAMKAQVESDLGVGGEAAMFERHRQRVTDEQNDAQIEMTVQFSSRGFDLPTGAWQSQNRRAINNKSKRLTDVSADIMQARNQQAMSAGVQLSDLLGRLHDSKIMRDFEAAKSGVSMALEGFKATIEGLIGQANIDKTLVDATIATNDGTLKKFLGELDGQLKPIGAIADVNQSMATAYGSAVQAATGAVQSSIIPEELKIKQVHTQLETAKTKAAILSDTTKMAIEDAYRHTSMSVETMKAVSLQAAQMIAASWNTVSASVSYGYAAHANTAYNGSKDTLSADVKYQVDKKQQAGVN